MASAQPLVTMILRTTSWARHTSHLSLELVSVFGVTGPNRSEESTVRSLSTNLPELLMAMEFDGRALICIAEFSGGRYIQFRVESGATVTEVVSNRFLTEANALNNDDQEHLRSIGFIEPSTSRRPNWRHEITDSTGVAEVVRMANSAITSALHVSPNEPVRIRTFEAPGDSKVRSSQ